jgi:hypothetical protein
MYVITGIKVSDSSTIYVYIYDVSSYNTSYVYLEYFGGYRRQTEQ